MSHGISFYSSRTHCCCIRNVTDVTVITGTAIAKIGPGFRFIPMASQVVDGIDDNDDLTSSARLQVDADVDVEYSIGKNDAPLLNSPTSSYNDLSTSSARLQVDADVEYSIGKNDVPQLNSPTSLYIEDLKKNNEVLRDLLKRLESRSRPDQSDLDLGRLLQATEDEIAYLNDPYESEVSIHSDDRDLASIEELDGTETLPSLTTHPFEVPPVKVKALDNESYKKYLHNSTVNTSTTAVNSDSGSQLKLSATKQRLALEKKRAKDRKKKDLLIQADKLMAQIEKEAGMDPSTYAKFNTEKKNLFRHRRKETDDDDDDEIHRENLAKDCIKTMRLKLSGGDEETLKKNFSKSEKNLLRSPFGDPITRHIMVNLGFPPEEDTSKVKKRSSSPSARKHK